MNVTYFHNVKDIVVIMQPILTNTYMTFLVIYPGCITHVKK